MIGLKFQLSWYIWRRYL